MKFFLIDNAWLILAVSSSSNNLSSLGINSQDISSHVLNVSYFHEQDDLERGSSLVLHTVHE